MNRHYLKLWSAGLSDLEFTQALAIAGTLRREALDWADNSAHSKRDTGVRLPWKLAADDAANLPTPQELLMDWKAFNSAKRVFTLLLENTPSTSFAARCDFASALASLPGVLGVTVECDRWWAQATPWRLPISIAALDSDSISKALIDRNRWAPPNWPFQYAAASRQFDRHQALVLSDSLDTAFATLQNAPPKLKANLAIINGLGDETLDNAEELMERIAARLSLSGVALIRESMTRDDLVDEVHRFAFEMSHDLPVDAAIQAAFGDDTILFGNVSLLREARMSTQVSALATRMAAMPKMAKIVVGERSVGMLTRSKPPPSAAPMMDAQARIMMSASPEEMSAAMASAAPTFEFAGESHEASALTELAGAVRKAAASGATTTSALRCVQQQCFIRPTPAAPLIRVSNAFAVDESVVLKVRIGDQSDEQWQSSTVSFPDQELPANESKHRLTVMFFEPNHFGAPMLADIELPQVGISGEATFEFVPKVAANFEARISIIHRGRILQTAILKTQILASRKDATAAHTISLVDETHVRHDWTSLDQRPRFDLAFICNHDSTNASGVTAIAESFAWAPSVAGIESAVTEINAALSEVAKNTKDYRDGLDKGENPRLLTDLAFSGRELFMQLIGEQLLRNTAGQIDLRADHVTHVQIVSTRPDAIIPIEFIYDYPPPKDGNLIVCPNHRAALESGHCDPDCRNKLLTTKHVCPLGFWGLRKVIERHTSDIDAALVGNPQPIVPIEATNALSKLSIRNAALVGRSRRVTSESIAPLVALLEQQMEKGVINANNWDEWASAVSEKLPQLLIAFPHNSGSGSKRKLELGKVGEEDSELLTTNINMRNEVPIADHAQTLWHVRAPSGEPPMVLLLGCDTAGTAETFGSHVAKFRLAGAAIVVSTIATVFGEHAVRVGTTIVEELLKRTSPEIEGTAMDRERLGEILRDAKRAALLQSLPMALCVVAFGDADWSL
jgi:hypothetical protein